MIDTDLLDLRSSLDAELAGPSATSARAHARSQAIVSAIVSEAFRRNGMEVMVVGGSALEFHAPGAYETSDIDLVVGRSGRAPPRAELDGVFSALGFRKGTARHWTRDEILIEVPGYELDDPWDEHAVGGYRLKVVKKEVVLVGRVVEYDQTGHTGHGAQAILMLRVFRDSLDHELLVRLVQREQVMDAYGVLSDFANRNADVLITDEDLRSARERYKRGQPRGENVSDGD